MTDISKPERSIAVAALVVVLVTPAWAQDFVTPGAGERTLTRWTVGANYERFGYRDVARGTRPVDASPVTLSGSGPGVRARYSRLEPRRLHQLDLSGARATGLAYETRAGSLSTPPGNRYTRLEASYEYRRYPLTDLLMAGLDVGVGVQGSGGWTSLERAIAPAQASRDTTLSSGIAAVAAFRLRRWNRVDVVGSWTNGGVITRRHLRHSATAVASSALWGGGWQSDWLVGAEVRTSARTRLSLEAFRGGGGRLASHQSYVLTRTQLTMGVTYER